MSLASPIFNVSLSKVFSFDIICINAVLQGSSLQLRDKIFRFGREPTVAKNSFSSPVVLPDVHERARRSEHFSRKSTTSYQSKASSPNSIFLSFFGNGKFWRNRPFKTVHLIVSAPTLTFRKPWFLGTLRPKPVTVRTSKLEQNSRETSRTPARSNPVSLLVTMFLEEQFYITSK